MPRAPPEQSFFVGMDAYYMAPKKPKSTDGSSSKSVKSSSASGKAASSSSSSKSKSKSSEGSSSKQDSKSKQESKSKASSSSSNTATKKEEKPKPALVAAPPEPSPPIGPPTTADKEAETHSTHTLASKKSSDLSVKSSSTTSTKKKAKTDAPPPIGFFSGMESYYGAPKAPKSDKSLKSSKSKSTLKSSDPDRSKAGLGVGPSVSTFESGMLTEVIDVDSEVVSWIEREPSTPTAPSESANLPSSLPRKSAIRPSLETNNLSKRTQASYSGTDSAGSPITEKRWQDPRGELGAEASVSVKDTNISANKGAQKASHGRTKSDLIYNDPGRAFVTRNGKKHHGYKTLRAPYPRSYDSKATDLETTDHLCFMKLSNSITFHDFSSVSNSPSTPASGTTGDKKSPPRTVLDLGCGNGLWVLDAAKAWPDTHFVGLDLVPIQPNLDFVARDLRTRIRWVNANFLDSLPFPTSYFDFVHVRRIARGVPEDKWPSLLEEISRVLSPDGALEIVEDDLIFPGGSTPCNCHHPPALVKENDVDGFVLGSSPKQHGLPSPPTTPTLPTWDLSQTSDPCDHSALEQAYNDMHSDRFINIMPLSLLANMLPLYFKDVRSHAPILVTFPPPEEEMWTDAYSSSHITPSASRSATPLGRSPVDENQERLGTPRIGGQGILSPVEASTSTNSDAGSSFGGSPIEPNSPSTRRGIEAMLSTQNLSPRATLSPSIPIPSQRFPQSPTTTISDTEYIHDPPPGGWQALRLSMNSLLLPNQRFFMLDRCRMPALSIPVVGNSTVTDINASMLTKIPNMTFDMDLQWLTLGLTLSVTEVLECKESIWEYLVKSGQASEAGSAPVADPISETSRSPDRVSSEGGMARPRSSIAGLSPNNGERLIDRVEFDHWVSKYERDMTTRIGMAKALQRRFGWNARDLATGAHPRSPSKYSPLAGVSMHGRIFTPESNNNFPVGEGMAMRGRGEMRGTERSLLPYDEDYEEEEEGEEVDALLGLKEEEFGPAYEPAHASSVSVLGHEGDGRPIRHVYTMQGQTVTRKGRPSPQQLSELDESIWREELPRLSRCIKVFVAWNNKSE